MRLSPWQYPKVDPRAAQLHVRKKIVVNSYMENIVYLQKNWKSKFTILHSLTITKTFLWPTSP